MLESGMPEWPDELDALIAAPEHHRLLLENDSVRVLETRIEAGGIVPMHTHRWPGVSYILSWSAFIRRDEQGNVTLDTQAKNISFPAGAAIWQDALGPHTLENVGDRLLHVVTVEMKQAH